MAVATTIPDLPEFQFVETVMDRGEYILLRALVPASGKTCLIQIFKRMLPESTAFSRLKHGSLRIHEAAGNGILVILEVRSASGKVCLIREDFPGVPLDVFLNGQNLDLRDRISLAHDMVSILEKIHRGESTHLSLAPDNILVDPADFRVKLWNCFGETREAHASDPGDESDRFLPFLAPEQFGRLNRAVDHRTDLYACGILIYLILAKRLPFQARGREDWIYSHLARTPPPPETWDPAIPPALSQLVLRLLAKDPDDRYQTAYGLLLDLKDCREQLDETGTIQVRSHSKNARRGEFSPPQRLYGRDQDLATLREAWESLGAGAPGVVLVSGGPGMGKSGLVHEWISSLPSGALLARGKFEQANRAPPFFAWRRAFDDLLRPLRTGSGEALAELKSIARECLGSSASLVGELLPELRSLLNPVPPATSGADPGMPRLLAGLERLLSALPGIRNGLAVILDDIQWADEASLRFFRNLAVSPAFPRLILIGAFRETGPRPETELRAIWERMGSPGGSRYRRVRLSPLSKQTLGDFIADSLGTEPQRVASLAGLVHMKCHGNPFHMREILTHLHRERILRFAPASGWRWDLGRLAKIEDGFTLHNLVAERWMRMTAWEREILQLAACAGTGPLLDDLIRVSGRTRDELVEALQGPLRHGFIQAAAGDYRFAHDRLWEAIYFQLPETQRGRLHARIARVLMHASDRDVYKIARHLQAANPAALFEGDGAIPRDAPTVPLDAAGIALERIRIARIYLEAAGKTKASASPRAALELYQAGSRAAGTEAWETEHALALDLCLGCMESAYLEGRVASGDGSFREILLHCRDKFELTRVYATRMTALGEANALDLAVASLRDALGLHGFALPVEKEGVEGAIGEELAKAERLKGSRGPQDVAEAPQITDQTFLAVTDLLSRSAMLLFYYDQNLLTLVQLKMVNLILEHGNTVQSPFAYLAYGWILAAQGEDYASAYAFGKFAVESVAARDPHQGCMLEEIHASMIQHWTRPFLECAETLRHAFRLGRESGDLQFAMLGELNRLGILLISGEPLDRLHEEFKSHAELFASAGNSYPGFLFRLRWAQIRRIRGAGALAAEAGENPAGADRAGGSALASGNQLALFNHHHSEEILAFLEDDPILARKHSLAAERFRGRANALPAVAEHTFYAAMILAALPPEKREGGRREEAAAAPGTETATELAPELSRYRERLSKWAGTCPQNYRSRHLLVEAECLRLEGRGREAEDRYLAAAREAEARGQMQVSALAFESAGRCYRAQGRDMAAQACFSQAMRSYAEWGAQAKADRLMALAPSRAPQPQAGFTSRPPGALSVPKRTGGEGGGRNEILDQVHQVILASRKLSPMGTADPLLKRLMETLMVISGAQKGCLLVREGEDLVLAAESDESGRTCLDRRREGDAPGALAWAAARFVNRNGKPLVLQDAHREGPFREDPRIRAASVRSLLCLPVSAEGGDRGLLYLENNALAGAFTPDRLELLELIAAQAAISLRNAQLYEQTRNLAAHLQSARESERRKIAGDVHDELGHALTALHLDLSWLALKAPKESPAFLEKVGAMSRLVENTVQTVQRIITELRPAVLDQLGLCEALEWLALESGKRSGLACHLDLPEANPPLSNEAVTALFRILQESLSNILRHAEARQVWIRLAATGRGEGAELRLEIRDDGKGITQAQLQHPLSFGLAGMRERLRPWNGSLSITPGEGGGTLVAAVLPAGRTERGEEPCSSS